MFYRHYVYNTFLKGPLLFEFQIKQFVWNFIHESSFCSIFIPSRTTLGVTESSHHLENSSKWCTCILDTLCGSTISVRLWRKKVEVERGRNAEADAEIWGLCPAKEMTMQPLAGQWHPVWLKKQDCRINIKFIWYLHVLDKVPIFHIIYVRFKNTWWSSYLWFTLKSSSIKAFEARKKNPKFLVIFFIRITCLFIFGV